MFESIKDYEAAAMCSNIVSTNFEIGNFESAISELEDMNKHILLMDESSKGYYGVMARYYYQKNLIYKKLNNIDSSYYFLEKSIEYERKSDWLVDQEEVSKNAVAFAIEKGTAESNTT